MTGPLRLATLVPLLALGCAGRTPEGPPPERALMDRARIPGLSLAVIDGGEVARTESLGVASAESGEPVTPDTLFEAASLSKPVFAAVALRLAERGELDLDRPLLELLDNERIAHDPRAATLTARHVLSHCTGLPNWGPAEHLELGFAPGERFGYSGEGFVYLQHVVEDLTGLGLDELARREVFAPLGMARSRFSWPAETVAVEGREPGPPGAPAVAIPHDVAGRPREKNLPAEGNAAASLHTTAAEYARFVVAWARGELFSAATLAEATAPAVRLPRRGAADGEAPELFEELAWGLGWGLELVESRDEEAGAASDPVLWHWGDNGPARAFVAYRPATGAGLVYFANSQNGLAIARPLIERHVAPLDAAFEWLDYSSLDDPGFEERLAGVVAEGAGDLGAAAEHFRAALATDPEDEATARRIDWIGDLLRVEGSPVSIPQATLARWAGGYGPRTLTWRDGELWYQREGRPEYRAIPLGERRLALDGLVDFRLEVRVDESGRPTALVGHYVDGTSDEAPRDPAPE